MAILKTSDFSTLYQDCYFHDGCHEVVIKEKQNQDKPDDIKDVTFSNIDRYTEIKSSFLHDSCNPFVKDKDYHSMRFRSDCDGVLIVERNGLRYLVWIELKTGFKDVCHSAIFQLAGSYVRIKSYLKNFAKYIPADYKEVAISVSFPDGFVKADNAEVKAYKANIVLKHSAKDVVEKAVRLRIKSGKAVYLSGCQFGCDTLGLSNDILLKDLRFIHIPIETQHGKVDLGSVLDSLG